MQHAWVRLVARSISTTACHQRTKSHYTALGITPAATQADIKAAYYRLTKMYHPDAQIPVGGGTEETEKFREVTAAYEVLGNVRTRKLYDKGVISDSQTTQPRAKPVDDDPSLKFYRSREVRSKPPAPTGRLTVYDFDEWSRQHYTNTFVREREANRKRADRMRIKELNLQEVSVERALLAAAVLFLSFYIAARIVDQHDVAVYVRSPERRDQATATDAGHR